MKRDNLTTLSNYELAQEFVIIGQRRLATAMIECYDWKAHKDTHIEPQQYFTIKNIFHDKVLIELDEGGLLIVEPRNVIDGFGVSIEIKELTKRKRVV